MASATVPVKSKPAERPVVVYDGHCGYCRRQVERLQRWDTRDQFEYVPRQAKGLDERFPALAEGDFNTGLRLIDRDGRIHVGADAIYLISRRLPRTKWAAWLYRVPGINWISQRAYAWIAKNRYRLAGSCESGACSTEATEPSGKVRASDQSNL